MTQSSAFFDVAQMALDCICTTMQTIETDIVGYDCPCRSYVSPGEPAFDNCCQECGQTNHGQLTVHIQDVFPTDTFPTPSAFIFPCAPAVLVAQLVVTVARCTPSPDEQGNPPSPEDLSANAELLATDLYAAYIGLTCCLTQQAVPGKSKRRVQIANAGITATPTEGGCAGIELRAYVEVGARCACPPEGS